VSSSSLEAAAAAASKRAKADVAPINPQGHSLSLSLSLAYFLVTLTLRSYCPLLLLSVGGGEDEEEYLLAVGGRLKQQWRLLGRQQRVQKHPNDEEQEACTRKSRYYNGWLGSASARG
jgi:hypothetical protein